MVSISQARHPAQRITGCIAVPRSASARAVVPANTSHSGWCTVRPRSTCVNSIRADSAIGQTRTTPPKSQSPTITTCITATGPVSSTRSGASFVPPRSMTGSRPEAPSSSRCSGGSGRVGTTLPAQASNTLSNAPIGGMLSRRKPWRCASAWASWTFRPSPSSM